MDERQVDFAIRHALSLTNTDFLGVYPRDRIPSTSHITRYPCSYVANTDTHDQSGSHWVAFYLESTTNIEFFDSYGMHPSFYDFNVGPIMHYNSDSFQRTNTDVCGEYCILFLSLRSHKQTLITIIRRLKSHHPHTDQSVALFVENLLLSKSLTLPQRGNGQSCSSRSAYKK